MKVIYNSRLLSDKEFSVVSSNRAFSYGDGLFETIVTGDNRLNLLDFHIDRLSNGGEVLGFKTSHITAEKLAEMINILKVQNGISESQRSRLQVWRKTGGLYSPESDQCDFLLTSEPYDLPVFKTIDSLGNCSTSSILKTDISFAKTMSSMPYVLAGLEKKRGQHDDLVILNAMGFVAETISSNLFWIKDENLFTPDLDTGCIKGIMRTYLLEILQSKDVHYNSVFATSDVLQAADKIFLTNASGMTEVRTYKGFDKTLPKSDMLETIIKPLLLP